MLWFFSVNYVINSGVQPSVQIATQCFQRSSSNILPRATTSCGFNTHRQSIIPEVFDRNTSQRNCWFMSRNCQLAPHTWVIIRELARCTRNDDLIVKMVSKSKLLPTRQKITLPFIGNTEWVKTVYFYSRWKWSSPRKYIWQPINREVRHRHEQN